MHKSFARPDADQPITFDVGPDAEDRFHCIPQCPAGILLDLATKAGGAEATTDSQVEAFIEFLEKMLVKEDRVRFKKRLRDPDRPIDFITLNEIGGWLMEQYTSRPSQTPSASPAGQPSTGDTSTVDVSSTTLTIPSASVPVGS